MPDRALPAASALPSGALPEIEIPDPTWRPSRLARGLGAARDVAAALGLLVLLLNGVGWIAERAGVRVTGAAADVAALAHADTALGKRIDGAVGRIDGIEGAVSGVRFDVQSLQNDVQLLTYIQCDAMRRTEGGAPSDCFDVLRRRRTPR